MQASDRKRVWIFLAFAFGIAWAGALVVYLTGGYTGPSATWLIAGLVMPAPAVAHVLTRLVTGEGWRDVGLRPQKRRWRYWLLAWIGTPILVVLGLAVYYLVLPSYWDGTMSAAKGPMPAGLPMDPQLFILVSIVQGIVIAPLINGLFTFGEEFGWRAYLQPKLMPLGGRKAMLLMGVIWGVWHAPIIMMGHNYGTAYAGAPFVGPLGMIWFCFVVGTFFGWLTLKGGSVWPAVIAHAALNGMANLPAFFTQGKPNLLIGPTVTGLLAGVGFVVVAALILCSRNALAAPAFDAAQAPNTATTIEP